MWRSDSHTAHKKKHRINCKKFSTAAAPHTHSSCGTEHACIYVAAASPLSTNIHCTRGNDTEHVDKFKSYKFYLSSLEIFLYCWKMCDSTLLYCEIGRSFFAVCCVCQRHTFTTYGNCDNQQQSSEMAKKKRKFLHREWGRRRRNNMQNVYKLSLEGDWDFSHRLSYFRIYSAGCCHEAVFSLAFALLLLVVVVCRLMRQRRVWVGGWEEAGSRMDSW